MEIEKIEEQWKKYLNLLSYIEDEDRKEKLTRLCEDLAEDLMVCPGSTKKEYIGCFPGGLVSTAIQTAKIMSKLSSLYSTNVSKDSIILLGLFYNLGKIGDLNEPFYEPNENEWMKEKRGIVYNVNNRIANIPIYVRTLRILNQYGVKLTDKEVYALSSLSEGLQSATHPSQVYSQPWECVLLQQAIGAVIASFNNNKKQQ